MTITLRAGVLNSGIQQNGNEFLTVDTSNNATLSNNLAVTGNTILGDATTDTLNVGAGGLVKDASGNVGIGTASPASFGAGSQGLTINGTGNYQNISWNVNGTSVAIAYTNGTSGFLLGTENSSPLQFQTAGTERMRVNSVGELLVGTAAGHASGLFCVTFPSNTYAGVSLLTSATTGQVQMRFSNGNGVVGAINTSGSATSYVTSSDYRLKENIAPMTGALATVSQLKPVTYSWKADGSDGQGFIAHELQAVVPDCVTGEKDAVDAEGKPVHQGIDTSFLVATLTAAIQELKAIVDAQAVRIAALEV
jgi:hypothetical protein